MSYSASEGAWLLTKELADGAHEFKYVVQSSAGTE